MLFFEIILWLVFILSFVGFTVVFGNRIFYNETRFITIREIMTPMILLVLHTTSVNVYIYYLACSIKIWFHTCKGPWSIICIITPFIIFHVCTWCHMVNFDHFVIPRS